jgi:hypothetical protein
MVRVIFHRLIAASVLLVVVSGCGYTLQGRSALPFDEIAVERIENKTVEPKLEDYLYTALTEEFLRKGIAVNPGAGHRLSGSINRFDLRMLSEKSDIAAEYEVIMKGVFSLTDPSGNTREFRDISPPFIVSFSGFGPLEVLTASKEQASKKAIRDIAMQIVAALLYHAGE